MAEIAPLRGIHFDRSRSGPIGPLIAPPYDVASAKHNRIECSISEIENADLGYPGDQHLVAVGRYRDWLQRGVLRRDSIPAIYLHHHQFDVDGEPVVRTGLLARVRLHDWNDRVVLPHERTLPGPRLERLDRLRAVGANLSPLYFLYRDPSGEMRELLSKRQPDTTLAHEQDRMGGVHWLAPLTDKRVLDQIVSFFSSRTLFVADGHHRYEAALAYRNEQRGLHVAANQPWEYVLALLAAVEDPGVRVRPTHRLLSGDDQIRPGSLVSLLRRWFDVREESRGAEEGQVLFRVVLPDQSRPLIARPLPGSPHRALLRQDRGPAWQMLGVTAVEGVLESLLGANLVGAGRNATPIVDEPEAIAAVRRGDAQAAFLLPAPNLDRLLAVAEEGDLLPAKSTWFEPKAPAGLIINDMVLSAE